VEINHNRKKQTLSIPLIPSLKFSFNSSGVPGLFVYNLAVSSPQRKWQGTEKLGELADRTISPKRKVTRPENVTLTQNIESRAVCVLWQRLADKTVTIDITSVHLSRLQHYSISC
jgi:hypothetical protein